MSKDKLSTAISSNHQYLGAVLIDWTNSYHFRTTHIKGSTPFPFQTSFLSFSIFLSFLFHLTLVLSLSLSLSLSLFFLIPSYFYLKGHLFSVLTVSTFLPNQYLCFFTQLPIRHTEKFPRVYFEVLTFAPLSVNQGHIKMIVIALKVDAQDTKMLYTHTTNVTTIITKNILPLPWGNKLSLHRDPRRKKIHFKKGSVRYVLCKDRMVVVKRAHECSEALVSRFSLSNSELINTTQSAMQELGEFTSPAV